MPTAAPDLFALCSWPPLGPPYDQALQAAVRFILAHFEVSGILVSGTILRGNPGLTSDLDLCVVHTRPQRQRLQRFFNGVPAEIFVNPLARIEAYMHEEKTEGRPITAHMWATGFVILDRDPAISGLRQRARAYLAMKPDYPASHLAASRYLAATLYEDARDIAGSDPANAALILAESVHKMLHYCFYCLNEYVPREKDLLGALAKVDPSLAGLARQFYSDPPFERRLALAAEIASRTIATQGFFEWESPLEDVRD